MSKWFYLADGQQAGPIESAALKQLAASGHLKPTDKVRRMDLPEWHQAKEVKGLFNSAAVSSSSRATPMAGTPPAIDRFASTTSDGNGVGPAATPNRDSPSVRTAGHDHSTQTTDKVREGVSSVWTDLRSLNFWEEIVPIDSSNFGRMLKDPVILAVIGAAVSPLVICTLRPDLQLTAFAMLFAMLWGMVFRNYIVCAAVSWKLLLGTMFFTGIVGLPLLLACYAIVLPRIYLDMADSKYIVVSLIGYLFQVGIWEEVCKILPVVVYLLWTRRRADPKVCILIGVFSGLGFAAFENLQKESDAILKTLGFSIDRNLFGVAREVHSAMVTVLVRSLSCVFSHALYTGIFSYFLIVAVLTGRRYIALTLTGLAVSASIHGFYDWVGRLQETLPAVIIAGTFILFYAFLLKLQALTNTGPTLEPSDSAT